MTTPASAVVDCENVAVRDDLGERPGYPDRDLYEELLARRSEVVARFDDGALTFEQAQAEIIELVRDVTGRWRKRVAQRKSDAFAQGADCGAWHWDTKALGCRPDYAPEPPQPGYLPLVKVRFELLGRADDVL
jgi:hypothetical protein